MSATFEGPLTLSGHLDYFEHRGAYYVYHNLFGYILQMSPDILELLEFFRGHARSAAEVNAAFVERFEPGMLDQFIGVLSIQHCLVEPDIDVEHRAALKMVPVLARWIVVEQPPDGAVVLLRADHGDEVDTITLDAWDSALWRLIDGERTLSDIVEALRDHDDTPGVGPEQKALASIFKLTHSAAQFLKLSPRPMSAFRNNRRATPPYLVSAMPYTRVTEQIRGESQVRVEPEVEAQPISREQLERDRVETTLAHLMRRPHQVLGGRSYGAALADHFVSIGALSPPKSRVLEVGAASADLSLAALGHLESQHDDLSLEWWVLTPTEALAEALRAEFAASGRAVNVCVGAADALHRVEGLPHDFDLIFSNEHAANLETVLIHKIPDTLEDEVEGLDGADAEAHDPARAAAEADPRRRAMFLGEGDGVNLILRHNLQFHDVDGEFFLNAGAMRMIEHGAARLAPGGWLTIVEFGDLFDYPRPSGEGPRQQFSLHFRVLKDVGAALGLQGHFEWLLERLNADVHVEMLATNRRHFRALRSLLARHGVELEHVAYTRQSFEALIEGAVALSTLRGVEFEPFNERAMGIMPASLKVLDLRRPPQAAPVTDEAAQ